MGREGDTAPGGGGETKNMDSTREADEESCGQCTSPEAAGSICPVTTSVTHGKTRLREWEDSSL